MSGEQEMGDVHGSDDILGREIDDFVPPCSSQDAYTHGDHHSEETRSWRHFVLLEEPGASDTPSSPALFHSSPVSSPWKSDGAGDSRGPADMPYSRPVASRPGARPNTTPAEPRSNLINEGSPSLPRASTRVYGPHGVSSPPPRAPSPRDSRLSYLAHEEDRKSDDAEYKAASKVYPEDLDIGQDKDEATSTTASTPSRFHRRQQEGDILTPDRVVTLEADAPAVTDPAIPISPRARRYQARTAFPLGPASSGDTLHSGKEEVPTASPGSWLLSRRSRRRVLSRFRKAAPKETTPSPCAREGESSRRPDDNAVARHLVDLAPSQLRVRPKCLGRWHGSGRFWSNERRPSREDKEKPWGLDGRGDKHRKMRDEPNIRDWEFFCNLHRIRGLLIRCCLFGLSLYVLRASSLDSAASLARRTVKVPSMSATIGSIVIAYQNVKEQRSEYTECIDRQVAVCKMDLIRYSESEVKRRAAIVDTANTKYELAANRTQSCRASVDSSVVSLKTWVSQGTGHSILYSGACTLQHENIVVDLIGDVTYPREVLAREEDDFLSNSSAVWNALALYGIERTRYDMSYVANKSELQEIEVSEHLANISQPYSLLINDSFDRIEEISDVLMSCVSPRGDNGLNPCLDETAREMLIAALATLESQLVDARIGFEEYSAVFADYQALAEAAHKNIMIFYEGVKSSSISIEGYGEWAKLTPEDFSLPHVSLPSAVGILTGYVQVPGIARIWENVSDAYSEYLEELEAVKRDLLSTQKLWASAAMERIKNTGVLDLDDYDPPQYMNASNDSETVIRLKSTASDYKETVEGHLYRHTVLLNDLGRPSADTPIPQVNMVYSVVNFSDSYVPDGEYTSWSTNDEDDDDDDGDDDDDDDDDDDSAGNLDILWENGLMDQLALVHSITNIFFSIIFSLHMAIFLWIYTGVNIPDGDMRLEKHIKSATSILSDLQNGFVRSLFGGGMCCCFALVVFVPLALALGFLSVSHYNDYRMSCVLQTKHGSIVSTFMYKAASKYAWEQGDSERNKFQESFIEEKAEVCSGLRSGVQEDLESTKLAMTELYETHVDSVSTAVLLGRCLDTSAMDSHFEEACCGLQGYESCMMNSSLSCPMDQRSGVVGPFNPVGEELSNEDCTEETLELEDWQLEDDIDLDCEMAPVCHVTCSGPSDQLLEAVIFHAGCMGEWSLLSNWLVSWIALATFSLTNLSRLVLITALIRRNWRLMHAGVFTYRATCDEGGELLIGAFAIDQVPTGGNDSPAVASRVESPSNGAPEEAATARRSPANFSCPVQGSSAGDIEACQEESGRASGQTPAEGSRDDTSHVSSDPFPETPSHLRVQQSSMHKQLVSAAVKTAVQDYENGFFPLVLCGIAINLPWMMLVALGNSDSLVYAGSQASQSSTTSS